MSDQPQGLSKQTRILAVDDSPTYLQSLSKRLTEAGFDVTPASSGPDGLSLLSEHPFDVAVVDVVMPEMDGFEFCSKARQWAAENNAHLGLLVLTGSARDDVLVQALDAGADDYVSKLQEMDVILAHAIALARRVARAKQIEALHQRERKQQPADAATEPKGEGLADFSDQIRTPIIGIIGIAESLLDTELTGEQKEHLKSIKQSADSLVRLLNENIEPACKPAEQQRAADPKRSTKAHASESPKSLESEKPEKHSDENVIDLESAEDRIPGGMDGVKELADILLEQCPTLMNDLRAAVDNNDASILQRAAHTLKGSADVFGARDVVAAAAELEQMGRNGNLANAEQALSKLQSQVSKLESALKNLVAAGTT